MAYASSAPPGALTAPSPHHHRTIITAPSSPHHHHRTIITTPSLHQHCTITARCPWHLARDPDEAATYGACKAVLRQWEDTGRDLVRFGEIPEGIDVLLTHGEPNPHPNPNPIYNYCLSVSDLPSNVATVCSLTAPPQAPLVAFSTLLRARTTTGAARSPCGNGLRRWDVVPTCSVTTTIHRNRIQKLYMHRE